MADSETERVTVRAYVPRYQKEEWDDHAEDLDMSLSEFIMSMVQAGRRGFDEGSHVREDPGGVQSEGAESAEDYRRQVLDALAGSEYRTWEELRDMIVGEPEVELEEALQSLSNEGRVKHSPRNGGYRMIE